MEPPVRGHWNFPVVVAVYLWVPMKQPLVQVQKGGEGSLPFGWVSSGRTKKTEMPFLGTPLCETSREPCSQVESFYGKTLAFQLPEEVLGL